MSGVGKSGPAADIAEMSNMTHHRQQPDDFAVMHNAAPSLEGGRYDKPSLRAVKDAALSQVRSTGRTKVRPGERGFKPRCLKPASPGNQDASQKIKVQ
jgi:hypothetical protein